MIPMRRSPGVLRIGWFGTLIRERRLSKKESTPPGAGEGLTAPGAGYAPPCPPPGHGLHHYHFKLYALDTMLDLAEDTMAPGLEAGMKGHVLAETELVGTYKRE